MAYSLITRYEGSSSGLTRCRAASSAMNVVAAAIDRRAAATEWSDGAVAGVAEAMKFLEPKRLRYATLVIVDE
jgi:hypothetical protein